MDAEELRHVAHYSPETGIFIARRSKSGRGRGPMGGNTPDGYVSITINGGRYLAHRLAWLYMTGEWPPSRIDHKNGVGSDNRWKNLRLASQSQNSFNSAKRKDNTSGFKGVYKHYTGKWHVRINANGIAYYIGEFDCPAAAHFARIIAADKLHGEFARDR